MTHGRKTVSIFSLVAALTVSATFGPSNRARPDAAGQSCAPASPTSSLPELPFLALRSIFPRPGARRLVLHAPFSADTVLVPTRRIVGVEDPFLQSPGRGTISTPHGGRGHSSRTRTVTRRSATRSRFSLTPQSSRLQHQLHIHIGCLLPYARHTLAAARRRSRSANGRRSVRSFPIRSSGGIASRERSF